MSLTIAQSGYKPRIYQWAYDAWHKQQTLHWLPEEVSFADDVKDYSNLTVEEKNLIDNILCFFTQADIDVAGAYKNHFMPHFKNHEIGMMLSAFANMECFDDKTELLTSKGWKPFSQITENDIVAQYNIKANEISFTKPKKIVSYDYNGLMHHYKNATTDICVTPNHDLILKHPSSGVVSKQKSYKGKWGGNYLYPKGGSLKNTSYDIDMNYYKLLIAIQADGCLQGLCPKSEPTWRTCDIKVTKLRKINRIRSLLKACGVSYSEIRKAACNEKYQDQTQFTFAIPGDIAITDIKNFNFIDYSVLNFKLANELLDEIIFWDGTLGGNTSYYNTNKQAIDKVQALAALTNRSAGVTINKPKGTKSVSPNDGSEMQHNKYCYVVTISKPTWRTYPYRKEIPYNGKVYCVSVETENLVTRRNDKIAITGNTIHIDSYAKLIDTLGMGDKTFSAFVEYKEMKDKHDYFDKFSMNKPHKVAQALAAFSAFGEGLQLFASFAMLLNFQRFNKMKGMGQIVTWSIRDETLHVESMIKLFKEYIEEYKDFIDLKLLEKDIRIICDEVISHEDKFIDLSFEMGDIEGLTSGEMKQYIRYIAGRRLEQLGYTHDFPTKNPLGWIEEILGLNEHANFFETRSTEYSKASTVGTWEDAYDD